MVEYTSKLLWALSLGDVVNNAGHCEVKSSMIRKSSLTYSQSDGIASALLLLHTLVTMVAVVWGCGCTTEVLVGSCAFAQQRSYQPN